ncbi:MAG: GDSL-type esterase/lipase family protein [Planctomycetaceae bacterium]|nr:GDSL-type esterase/lipase family protein [Planctomycetaceae bacterium]
MKSLSCLVALLLVSAALSAAQTYPNPNRWAEEIKAFDLWDSKNSVPEHPILFVGSSTIRLWKTAESFPNLPVINRGFGGSWMADSAHFADRLIGRHKPAVVVVYAGDNDIASGLSPQSVRDDFAKLADKIHAALPSTAIICLAIKPSGSRIRFWPAMKQANSLLEQYADEQEYLAFVDLTALLLDKDGQPDPALYEADALHLNAAGYAKWSAALDPILKENYESGSPN